MSKNKKKSENKKKWQKEGEIKEDWEKEIKKTRVSAERQSETRLRL